MRDFKFLAGVLLFSALIMVGCDSEDEMENIPLLDRVDPAQNTLSCMINGELYTPNVTFALLPREVFFPAYRITGVDELEGGFNPLGGLRIDLPDTVTTGIRKLQSYEYEGEKAEGPILVNFGRLFTSDGSDGTVNDFSNDGQINIQTLTDERISGTFEFVTPTDTVTEGVLDLHLVVFSTLE